MRKFISSALFFFVLLMLVATMWVVWVQSGPRSKGPSEDPVLRWNREHADLPENAAPYYQAAWEALSEPPIKDWGDFIGRRAAGERIPAELVEWLNVNGAVFDLIDEAAAQRDCWYELARRPSGNWLAPHLSRVRTLAKLSALRARYAAERRDLDTFSNSVWTIDRIGRHLHGGPTFIVRLVGVACAALAQQRMLEPFAWLDPPPKALREYAAKMQDLLTPFPNMLTTLGSEREESLWSMSHQPGRGIIERVILPAARIAGEYDLFHTLYLALAVRPVAEWTDPTSPLRLTIDKLSRRRPPKWNIAAVFPPIMVPSILRAFELDARIVTLQRGNRTALAIFDRQLETGTLPESLEFLTGDDVTDPYTGKPFFYRKTAEGFTLYSAGVDRDDDGGAHDEHFGEPRGKRSRSNPRPDGDYVFWPLPEPRGEEDK